MTTPKPETPDSILAHAAALHDSHGPVAVNIYLSAPCRRGILQRAESQREKSKDDDRSLRRLKHAATAGGAMARQEVLRQRGMSLMADLIESNGPPLELASQRRVFELLELQADAKETPPEPPDAA